MHGRFRKPKGISRWGSLPVGVLVWFGEALCYYCLERLVERCGLTQFGLLGWLACGVPGFVFVYGGSPRLSLCVVFFSVVAEHLVPLVTVSYDSSISFVCTDVTAPAFVPLMLLMLVDASPAVA